MLSDDMDVADGIDFRRRHRCGRSRTTFMTNIKQVATCPRAPPATNLDRGPVLVGANDGRVVLR